MGVGFYRPIPTGFRIIPNPIVKNRFYSSAWAGGYPSGSPWRVYVRKRPTLSDRNAAPGAGFCYLAPPWTIQAADLLNIAHHWIRMNRVLKRKGSLRFYIQVLNDTNVPVANAEWVESTTFSTVHS